MLWTSLLSAVPSHWTGSVSAFCEVAALVLSWAITRPVTHHRNIPRCLEMLAGSASSQLLPKPLVALALDPFWLEMVWVLMKYVTARPGKVGWGP